ncbi:hypothetical protein BGZ60DRAFT_426036 [Tricladium varicosporioides]|nr:hypothetical protein BGZ60DRAFT_426036 [Hymenoscyphus varicosporioides]
MALSRVPGDDELYVGGIFTLRRRNALNAAGITHIVSVLKYDFKDFDDWEKYEHLSIEVDDVEDENLLGEFERSGKWIENALKDGGGEGKGGKVLVHCECTGLSAFRVDYLFAAATRLPLLVQAQAQAQAQFNKSMKWDK